MSPSPHPISVILSTYNQPRLLEKVLLAWERQTWDQFEVIIADDGSGPDTLAVIEEAQSRFSQPLRRVWHEDNGFQKCRILNRAIEASTFPYLFFSDGDCIPRDDLLATHADLRRPGRFLSGGYFKLSEKVSESLVPKLIRAGKACHYPTLRDLGLPWSIRNHRIFATSPWNRWLDRWITTKATWNGHNVSGWRNDVLRARGFDERMHYGGEDRELGERLTNAGIHGFQVRYRAVCVHLWHGRPYVREDHLATNKAIRNETVEGGRTVTDHGLPPFEE